jgi:septum formation topological specificity factor MinE
LIEAITKPGFTDFEKEQESYEKVISHLTRPVLSESEKSLEKTDFPKFTGNTWKYLTKMAISNFNERFKHLNENEKKAFKILVSDFNTKSNYLESLRRENIEMIDKKIQNESDDKSIEMFNGFRNKLDSLQNITPQKIDEGIIACLELQEALK